MKKKSLEEILGQTIENFVSSTFNPTPSYSLARRQTDWTKLSNENLKFVLDVLSLHYSPVEVDAANEIERRIMLDTWLNLENPPPPLENLPNWLKRWPFCLLWKQRPR